MAYLDSKDVKMFPSAYRGTTDTVGNTLYDPESKLFSEKNITNLVKASVGLKKSFIISASRYNTTGWTITVCLSGYVFTINLSLAMLQSITQAVNSYIYVSIKLSSAVVDETNTKVSGIRLLNYEQDAGLLDENNKFMGLYINSTSQIVNNSDTSLVIIKCLSANNYNIYTPSQYKFQLADISIEDKWDLSDIITTNDSGSGVAIINTKEISTEKLSADKEVITDVVKVNEISSNNTNSKIYHNNETAVMRNIVARSLADSDDDADYSITGYDNIAANEFNGGYFTGQARNLDLQTVSYVPTNNGSYIVYVNLEFTYNSNIYRISLSGWTSRGSGCHIPVNYTLTHNTSAHGYTDVKVEGEVVINQSSGTCRYTLYVYEYADTMYDSGTPQYPDKHYWLQRTYKTILTGNANVVCIQVKSNNE